MLLYQCSNYISMESLAFLKIITGKGGADSKGKEQGNGRLDVISGKERGAKERNRDFISRASVHWL